MRRLLLAILLLPVFAFSQQKDLIKYVNPLIGTQRMGHTYPGATVPFGMVQLSPETDTISYEKTASTMVMCISIVQVINMTIKLLQVLVILILVEPDMLI